MIRSQRSSTSNGHVVEPGHRLDADGFRLLVESTIDYAIFMLDPQGHVVSWNLGAQRIKGYRADEIIGRHFSVFYPPEARAREWPQFELKEAARVGRFEDEGWRIRRDGSCFWANVVITALRDADGDLRGFAKVTRDMTERKAHEERIENLTKELRHRVDELAASNRELSQKSAENESFVYSVSHDLRSPLVNLQGFSHELVVTLAQMSRLLEAEEVPAHVRQAGRALLDGDLRESVGFINTAVRHLGNIIDSLLRLSRAGRIEYELSSVDAGTLVAEVLSATHSTIVSSRARVEVGALPVVTADRNALAQLFANLLDNALKSFDPSRPGVIEISASRSTPPVFAVRDNGVGIPKQYHAKVFQFFQQVHTGPARGEGMGLAIARRIAERHGGRIWFESEAGAGTTFFFTLGPGGGQIADGQPGDAR